MSTLGINAVEVFIVQTKTKGAPVTFWVDAREFPEHDEGGAHDHADWLREQGDTDARVVRRWK